MATTLRGLKFPSSHLCNGLLHKCNIHISTIFLTYVFSPLHKASCLDKIFTHTCQIIFNLSCYPFPLRFCFLFFSVWLVSLSSNFTLSQEGAKIFFTYSLAGIRFQFCFEHINPCFTTLCSQMLSLTIGLNFHTFYPCQPH